MADEVGGNAGARLKSLIERIERLHEERTALAEDIKEVFAEAKGVGFDAKAMKAVLKIRRTDPDDFDEQQALIETYLRALGMAPEEPGKAAAD